MQCTAHSSQTGKPCKSKAVKGATVCRMHGGSAPQVKAAAKRRLLEAADPAAAALVKIALDEDMDPRVRVMAIRDLLDRAGISEPKQVEVVTLDAIDREIARLEAELGELDMDDV